jgi:hypothetical protein
LEVVLKKEYVENVEISLQESNVTLSFAEEEGYDYEVYQSVEPDRNFQIVDNGNWQNSYTWVNSISEAKMFYKIRRILSE